MKTVIMEKEDKDNINFSEINSRRPIFAKKEGRSCRRYGLPDTSI
jgi:hypothetical protein